jgi:hypothetical protein
MTPATPIPRAILAQHIAVLGKTGSGKTSTAKLAIEQVVAEGSRVCVIDPIKSDWWGLTSSADGKRAGLPFHILGGPRGHVPLHSAAGKAIADVVASGGLPLSILDMADFEPGGQARFFVDFAPTLLRKMRGVVYLVIEEAHLFAPKERSGIGAENLSIHWAKTMATAGRSKGIRLVLVTQRTQALHNALLGSCDTLIAHRLTAPADQEPVVKWLKANTTREVLEEVSGSLASLKTGEGWICSGEAKVFAREQFPRIHTYDNTATPTGDGETREVKTAAVDAEKLRSLIGQAVDEAKANDPRELKRQIAELRAQLAKNAVSVVKHEPAQIVEKPVLTDWQLSEAKQIAQLLERLVGELRGIDDGLHVKAREISAAVAKVSAFPPAGRVIDATTPRHRAAVERLARPQIKMQLSSSAGNGDLSGPEMKILTSVAELEALKLYPADKLQVALLAGYTNVRSGGFSEPVGRLVTNGYLASPQPGVLTITDAGVQTVGHIEPPQTAEEMQARVMAKLTGPEQKLLSVLIAHYPKALTKDALAAACDPPYTNIRSGGFSEPLGRLNRLGLVQADRGQVAAAPVLFLER